MSLTGRSRRGAVSFSIFEEYHESMLQLERSYHAAGVAVEFYETINEKMERTIVLINSFTKTP